MLTNAALFERELKLLIAEEIERLKENLTTTPASMESVGGISYLQGGIAALRGLDDLMEIAKTKSDQRSR
jgi:actin-like ATPase involved in cell morphogenesis